MNLKLALLLEAWGREFDAQVRRDRARHAQLVGEHVADQPRHVPGRPALGRLRTEKERTSKTSG
jgi:hypothetical protein